MKPQVPRKSKARTLADMHGGTLDDFLAEEGILEECTAAALDAIAFRTAQASARYKEYVSLAADETGIHKIRLVSAHR